MNRRTPNGGEPQPTPAPSGPDSEYLAFSLGKQEYCIEAAKVQDIRSYVEPNPVADVPDFIKGVLKLGGAVVPVVDLRIRFGSPEARYDELTAMIVLIVGARALGLVVDSAADVVELAPEQIRPALRTCGPIAVEYLVGEVELGRRKLRLLDIDRLIASKDMPLTGLAR